MAKAVEHVAPNHKVSVTSDAAVISEADRVICPGQGAAADCMHALTECGLTDVIKTAARTRPFFGICMGLQVLLTRSDENDGVECLDVLPGVVRRFAAPLINDSGARLKVPHMGWNEVTHASTAKSSHPMWQGIDDRTRFYFAHSYYCDPNSTELVAAYSDYGRTIAVALATDSVFACQFHPEKSSVAGLKLLSNFVGWDGKA